MKKLLVGILLALLLGLGIGYAARQDTFFKRCLHAYNYDVQSDAASRRRVERMCLNREISKGDRR